MIKFNSIKAATVAASNGDEVGRMYDIFADVETKSGKSVSVQNGKVLRLGEECTEKEDKAIATFSGWNEKQLSISIKDATDEEQDGIFSAVCLFVKELRAKGGELTKDGKLNTSLFA